MKARFVVVWMTVLLATCVVTQDDACAQKLPLAWPVESRLIVSPAELPVPALRFRLLPPVVEQTPGNAAMLYLAAFPAGADVDFDTVEKYLKASFDQFPKDEAASYVARFADALRQIEVAGRRAYCHWDDPIREEGLRMTLKYVRNGRLLGRVLALRIRLEIHEGRYDEAVRSLQAGFALARAYSTEACFLHAMGSTDGDGIEAVLYDRLREWTEARGSPNLYWALANLTRPFHDRRHLLEVEDAALYFTFPGLRQPEQLTARQAEQVLEQLWQLLEGQSDASAARKTANDYVQRMLPQAKEALTHGDHKTENAESLPAATTVLCCMVAEYRRELDEVYKWAGMPYWQSSTGVAMSIDRYRGVKTDNPLFKLLPRINFQFLLIEIRDREAALLQSIEALRAYAASHDGTFPPSLEALSPETPAPNDPVLGRPFEYHLDDGTAILKAPSPFPGFPDSEREYRVSVQR